MFKVSAMVVDTDTAHRGNSMDIKDIEYQISTDEVQDVVSFDISERALVMDLCNMDAIHNLKCLLRDLNSPDLIRQLMQQLPSKMMIPLIVGLGKTSNGDYHNIVKMISTMQSIDDEIDYMIKVAKDVSRRLVYQTGGIE